MDGRLVNRADVLWRGHTASRSVAQDRGETGEQGMYQSSSGVTGPSPAAVPPPTTETTSSRLGRLVLFALAMIVTIGAAAALPLWLLG